MVASFAATRSCTKGKTRHDFLVRYDPLALASKGARAYILTYIQIGQTQGHGYSFSKSTKAKSLSVFVKKALGL